MLLSRARSFSCNSNGSRLQFWFCYCFEELLSTTRKVRLHRGYIVMVARDQEDSTEDAVPVEPFIRALLLGDEDIPIARENAEHIASTILRTTNICSQENVKECKDLILEHIIAPGLSTERIQVLCKYLVALSRSFVPKEPWKRMPTDAKDRGFDGLGKIVRGKLQQPPQQAFRRLHLLYIVHDLLLWFYKHSSSTRQSPIQTAVIDVIKSRLPALVGLAAFRGSTNCTKTLDLVLDVIKVWEEQHLFDSNFLRSLHSAAYMADAELKSWHVLLDRLLSDAALYDLELKVEKEPDWLVPLRHGRPGDLDAPWHEIPAANGLHMRRTHGYPLQWRAFPIGGYELEHGGRRAQNDLITDVKHLHTELLHCFDQRIIPDEVQDVDALGSIIWKDPERETRNHWGNSYGTVEKRRKLARHFKENCVGYEGLLLQPKHQPDLRDSSESYGTAMSSSWREQRESGGRGAFNHRGGFSDDSGGYGFADHGRGGSNRGGYLNRSGYSGRGGRPGRGSHNSNGEYSNEYSGNRPGYHRGG
nr:hypothetical protein CFP56_30094 [Quercus suber]